MLAALHHVVEQQALLGRYSAVSWSKTKTEHRGGEVIHSTDQHLSLKSQMNAITHSHAHSRTYKQQPPGLVHHAATVATMVLL